MVMTQTGLKINLLCLLITGVAVGPMQGAISFYAVTSMTKVSKLSCRENVPRFRVKVIKQQQQHITMGQELLAAWILGPKCRASAEESVLFLLYE